MSGWLRGLRIYADRRLAAILALGFASGLPLPLTTGTLALWLTESGVSLTSIGLFALVGVAYSFKFVWSPLLDRLPLPGLTARLGRRRGWLLGIELALAASILGLGLTDPARAPWLTAVMAVTVSFLSASQDIVVDAFRIELLEREEQGAGAAAVQWGYRIGMLAGGAGVLYAAAAGGWPLAFAASAALLGVGVAAVLLTPEPIAPWRPEPAAGDGASPVGRLRGFLRSAVAAPLLDLAARPGWVRILLFVVLYKLGDALAGVMANPFYIEMGFSKVEIANVSKLFGVAATLAGVGAGGLLVYRAGLVRGLVAAGVVQMLSNLMYVAQSHVGHDVPFLTLTIFVENFSGGLGSAAFVAYLSALCNVAYTATQYALLSSLAATGRTVLSSSGGFLADLYGWPAFFMLSTAVALPGLLLAFWLGRGGPQAAPAGRRALPVR